jgi:hypothetical protein
LNIWDVGIGAKVGTRAPELKGDRVTAMQPQAPQSCLQLDAFRHDCIAREADWIRSVHGDGFLLHHGSLDSLHAPGRLPARTVSAESVRDGDGLSPQWNFLVFPLRSRHKASVAFISVGRAEANDVVIPDMSVSVFQAFFFRHADGRLFLQDANSKNGTFVDDVRVPSQGNGEPVALEAGARIRFGSVDLTYLPAEEFRDFVRTLARNGPRPA